VVAIISVFSSALQIPGNRHIAKTKQSIADNNPFILISPFFIDNTQR
jgi:hypothetical protein